MLSQVNHPLKNISDHFLFYFIIKRESVYSTTEVNYHLNLLNHLLTFLVFFLLVKYMFSHSFWEDLEALKYLCVCFLIYLRYL